jgi:hypothetical protein
MFVSALNAQTQRICACCNTAIPKPTIRTPQSQKRQDIFKMLRISPIVYKANTEHGQASQRAQSLHPLPKKIQQNNIARVVQCKMSHVFHVFFCVDNETFWDSQQEGRAVGRYRCSEMLTELCQLIYGVFLF